MADDNTTTNPDAPAEGTPLPTGDASEWGDDVQLSIPTAKTEANALKAEEAPKDELTADEPVEEVVEPEEAPAEPEAAVTATDPGDYVPSDYSFDITVYDEEGKKGKTVTVKSVEQWDELLDQEPNFGSAAALMKAQRLATKMESNQERDQAEWQREKEAYDLQVQSEAQRTESLNGMANEISYLVSKGDLPPVAKEYTDANWADPEVAKQPGVKEQIALLKYMQTENAARLKAGLKPMTSVLDAFNAYQLDQAKKQGATARKQAGEARKAAGARVAASSPNPVTVAPKGIMVGRGGSLNDLANLDWS